MDGTGAKTLIYGAADNKAPAWSPDGRRIAFWSNRAGKYFDLYTANPDGSDPVRLTQDAEILNGTYQPPSWSPDGQYIAFSASGDEGFAIYVVDINGSGRARLTSGTFPSWSR